MERDSFTNEQFSLLLERHRKGLASPKEERLLRSYYDLFEGEPDILDILPMSERERIHQRLESRLFAPYGTPLEPTTPRTRVRRLRRWLPYAAAVLLVASVVGYFAVVNRQSLVDSPSIVDIQPGGNKATLTLADGTTVDLSSEQSGIIVGDGITYLDGSAVVNEQVNKSASEQGRGGLSAGESGSHAHKLTTPKGGTYQVTLPDGSKVWLNAASTLTYPSHFTDNERVVELAGEGYFAIKKDSKRPFKVRSAGQEVEVLGTEFNLSAYPDEAKTNTTLVEGTVQIVNRQSTIANTLKPGEQSTVRGATTVVQNVEIERYTAWKNGYFYFKKTPLEDVLRQAARWYDIEVVYRDGVLNETFSGDIKRDVSLRGLLEIMQLSTINVTLEGRTLIVHK